jgi:hypothetical protein
MMTILLALAELEVARIREGWEHANRRAVERGVHPAPYPPTGYKRSTSGRLVPDSQAASVVAEAFRRRARGDSYDTIARVLEQAGVVTSRGNSRWTDKTVFRMISNPAYTGEARYGQYRNPTAHEPLVSRRLWISVQPGMPGRPPRPNAKSLLAGLIRCASCLHAMAKAQTRVARGRKKGMLRTAYCCRALHGRGRCPAPAYVSMDAIDAFITEKFFGFLERREGANRPTSPWASGFAEPKTTGLEDLETGDTVSWGVLARSVRAAKLLELPPIEDVRQAWPSMPCSLRRTYLAAVFDAILVTKGRRQLESRVRVLAAGDLCDQTYGGSLAESSLGYLDQGDRSP